MIELPPRLHTKLIDLLCQVPRLQTRSGRDAWLEANLPSTIYPYLKRSDDQSCENDLSLALRKIEGTRLQNGEWCLLNLIDDALISTTGLAVSKDLSDLRAEISWNLTGEGPADAGLSEIPTAFEELTIGKDEKLPVTFLYDGAKAAAAVAKVKVTNIRGETFAGSGWLVAPGLLITNYHVVRARKQELSHLPEPERAIIEQQARSSLFNFDYEYRKQPEEFGCDGLVEYDISLDYAILKVSDRSKSGKLIQEYPFLRIAAFRPRLERGVRLNVIQHPEGRPKEVALRSNYYIGENAQTQRLFYLTDTMEGSSGSPVMDDDWMVVALHRGYDLYSKYYQGQPIRFSSLGLHYQGDPQLSEQSVVYMNEGVAIYAIIEHLKDARQAVLEAQPWLEE